MNEKDVINQLQLDLKKITIANGYSIDVRDVKQGIHLWKNMEKAGLSIWASENDVELDLGDNQYLTKSRVNIAGYGYPDILDVDRSISELSYSVMRFLSGDDWTYCNDTKYVRREMHIGNESDAPSTFLIEVDIKFIEKY